MSEGAGRASVALTLGLSNENRSSVSANMNFLSRVLRLFTHRKHFSLAIGYVNSLGMSTRRATRSVNVYLNGTFYRTMNSGGNVGHCNSVLLPVSRTLVVATISFSNEDFLDCNLSVPARGMKSFSARLIYRFFLTFIETTRLALRVGRLTNAGSRRVVRNAFGSITETLGTTITCRTNFRKRVPSAGKML